MSGTSESARRCEDGGGGTDAPRTARPGVLRDRDFARLFAATAFGQLGDRVVFLALPLVALTALRAGAFEVGLLTAMTTAGSLLVGLPAGAWVDRAGKRSVMVRADLGRALVLLSVPSAWWAGLLTIEWLYAVALVHGVLTVFFDVAYQSCLPQVVGRDRLVEANARLSTVRSVTSIGGPALAGPLVALVGAPATLLAGSMGMALSGLLALTLRTGGRPPRAGGRRRLAAEIGEGLRFVLGHPVLRAVMLGDSLFNLCLVMYQSMLLVFLEREIALGAFGMGLIFAGMGCGALLGALTAGVAARRIGQGRVVWAATLATCPLTALMPLARPGWSVCAAAAGLAALSLGGVVRVVAQSSLQQALTPDRLLGRTSATVRFVSWGGIPLGGLLGGAAGTVLGARGTLWAGAAGMTVSVVPVLLSPLRSGWTPPAVRAPGPQP
ncbi:MFS transporter [Streptomyces sp. NPDC057682]|uniref:MFS transporter n=1 Tax=Streptomyces sp. NPDC057682 TaxID=3346210 RepID=UPI00367D5CA1